jgi:riboflavin kinase/FMN adenylyltransferase
MLGDDRIKPPMELIRADKHALPRAKASVISIGNYDGVHAGHRELIRILKDQARAFSVPATVMTFEPYPQNYFQPDNPPTRLTTFREKLKLLQESSVDRVICLRFNQELAETKADEFIERCLVERLNVRHLVVGEDFHFGRGRTGSVGLLHELALAHGFGVTGVKTVRIDGERVSSSRIRELLIDGNLDRACVLLGRRFSMSGHVAYGDQRGRTLGFPTANIYPRYEQVPLRGVFAVLVTGVGGRTFNGIANLGHRPTVSGDKFLLEVHCFDFDKNIYGQRIQVEFCHWIRNEKKFTGPKALQAQIQKDVDQVRHWFRDHFAE